jgi:hypothetical protein
VALEEHFPGRGRQGEACRLDQKEVVQPLHAEEEEDGGGS